MSLRQNSTFSTLHYLEMASKFHRWFPVFDFWQACVCRRSLKENRRLKLISFFREQLTC